MLYNESEIRRIARDEIRNQENLNIILNHFASMNDDYKITKRIKSTVSNYLSQNLPKLVENQIRLTMATETGARELTTKLKTEFKQMKDVYSDDLGIHCKNEINNARARIDEHITVSLDKILDTSSSGMIYNKLKTDTVREARKNNNWTFFSSVATSALVGAGSAWLFTYLNQRK